MAVATQQEMMHPGEHPDVPCLTTATTAPLHRVETHLLDHVTEIEAWFRARWRAETPPFYASVDLRNAGFKLAPVDTNLFPAGFNNLNPAFHALCIQAIQSVLAEAPPPARRILLVPESHTRNTFYLESLAVLLGLLERAGFETRIGSLLPPAECPAPVDTPAGRLVFQPLTRQGARIGVAGFDPCLVLLNNDLSGGRPEILEGLEQPVLPPLALGWSQRLKSRHFELYHQVAVEFATEIGFDPWLIDPYFRNCGEVNFVDGQGMDCVVRRVTALFAEIQRKYDEYGIVAPPFCILKADAGTYGMGVMTVTHPDEVRTLNRKQRTRMAKTKEGLPIHQVILQEGVYTHEYWGEAQDVAEPVVYMIGRFVVGGFYRVHKERGATENLNAPGMRFEPLAFSDCCNLPDRTMDPCAGRNRFYAYGVIARLALLAAARETPAAAS
jgi:glutamate--cysteine ligase